MSYNDDAVFATMPFEICSFTGSVDRCWMSAGDDRICDLGATRGPIRLLRHFNCGSRHQQRVSEEGSLSLKRRNLSFSG